MVDFGGIPLLHRQIIKIDDCKVIKKVFVLIGHLADSIKEYFEDKKFKNLKIFFIEELEPLVQLEPLNNYQNLLVTDSLLFMVILILILI